MTDTNQASEDELLTKVKGLNVYKAAVNMHVSYRSDQTNLPRFAGSWEREILALIRTEKLKLLAEVRERVVGEDEHFDESDPLYKLTGEPFEWAERNSFRTDLRISLNKLEAEL